MDQGPKIRAKTIKTSEENIGVYLHTLDLAMYQMKENICIYLKRC